jgi:hypothetical protein
MEVHCRPPIGASLLIYLLFLHSSWAACFLPDGTDRNTVGGASPGDYLPCNATAEVSMCCAIGRATMPDSCIGGGLCKRESDGTFWRESCTDKSWKSPKCLKLFVDGAGQWRRLRPLQVLSAGILLILSTCQTIFETLKSRIVMILAGVVVVRSPEGSAVDGIKASLSRMARLSNLPVPRLPHPLSRRP